jgi:cell division protein FtsQ
MRAKRTNPQPKTPAKAKPARVKKTPSSKKISDARRRRPLLRKIFFGVSVVVILLVGFGLFWVWRQGYVHQAWRSVETSSTNTIDRFSFATGLELKEIKIEGHRYVSKEQLLAATGLDYRKHYSLLRLSGDELKERLENIEFIKNVIVEKKFPSTILLRVREREPIALWQSKGEIKLLDSEGVVLNVPKNASFAGLPVVVGQDAVFHAKALFEFLISEPILFGKIQAMSLIHDRRWDILLKNGVVIKLPESKPEQAWGTLARLDQQHQLLEKQIKTIDLRVPDKLYILPMKDINSEKKAQQPMGEKQVPDDHD